jgi:arylsulfatase A-like enzyme
MKSVHQQLLIFALFLAGSASAADKPNILLIYTDDHTHRSVSCYPEAWDWVKTPNIDALADKGVRFHHATIGTWCMASRATILTGKLQFGVESMRMEGEYPGSAYDPEKCPFWPKTFREQGYTTAHIGKWHTGVDSGYGRDWDFQVVWNRPKYTENAGHYYYDQQLEINGVPLMVPGYSTDNYTKWASDFIKGANRDAEKPWFLWVCYGAVHGPFTPADRHLEALEDVEVPIPADIYPPRPGKPAYMQRMNNWVKGEKDGQPQLRGGFTGRTVNTQGIHGNSLNDWVRQVHQGVIAIDEGVGNIVDALETSGQLENTLIIFTSDQGMGWGQHGFRHKLGPYDATIRSPMIVSMPGAVAEGEVCKTPVGGADIAPTIFGFAGLDLPWKMHGHDLAPLLKNPDAAWEHPVLMCLTSNRYGSDTDTILPPEEQELVGVPWWISLTKGHFKYIRTLTEGEVEELYDLNADPEELDNLAIKPKFRQQLLAMRSATIAELKRNEAGFVDNLPAVANP